MESQILKKSNYIFYTEKVEDLNEVQKREYLARDFFNSEFLIGKIKTVDPDDSKAYPHFCFVELCVPNNINQKYYINSEEQVWEVYGNLRKKPELATRIKEGKITFVAFKFKVMNHEKSKELNQIIEMDPNSLQAVSNYSTFLAENGFTPEKMKFPEPIGYDEEEKHFLVSSELYQIFEDTHFELTESVRKLSKQIENLKNEKDAELSKKIKALNKREQQLDEREQFIGNKLEILEAFGLSSYKKYIEDKNDSRPALEGNTEEKIKYIQRYFYQTKEKPITYEKGIFRRFYAGLQMKNLMILSGPSGTGKTTLVNMFAEATGNIAKIISVKPNWLDNQDLLGFYHPIESVYYSTPFLDALVEAKRYPDKLYLICLDEMNLAHVEYYFAEFLSKLELEEPYLELYSSDIEQEIREEIATVVNAFSEEQIEPTLKSIKDWINKSSSTFKDGFPIEYARIKKQIKLLECYQANFIIPQNVRFIGTINVDETTKQVSPKVIDRSFVIDMQRTVLSDSEIKDLKQIKVKPHILPASNFNLQFKDIKLTETQKNILTGLNQLNDDFLKIMNINYNNRTMNHQENYLKAIRSWEQRTDSTELRADLILTKILPRLVFSIKEINDKKYEAFKNFCDAVQDIAKVNTRLDSKLKQMKELAEKYKIVSYWGGY
jgi:energy-coupling factor transporter ATP-binding protein EcfA2